MFIDWNGTLSHSRFWDRWNNSQDKCREYEQIQDVLFHDSEGNLIIQEWMRGLRSFKNVLQYIHDRTGIPINQLASELQYSSENMKFIDSNVLNKIQTIRANGSKVVIATDNMDVFRYWTIDSLKLYDFF